VVAMQYMKIRYGETFSIPRRLGNLFREVVRIKGVEYIKGKGFIVRDYYALSNLNKILARLGLILTPEVRCFICGKYVDCEKCEFRNNCKRDVTICICDDCLNNKNILNIYLAKQNKFLGLKLSSSQK